MEQNIYASNAITLPCRVNPGLHKDLMTMFNTESSDWMNDNVVPTSKLGFERYMSKMIGDIKSDVSELENFKDEQPFELIPSVLHICAEFFILAHKLCNKDYISWMSEHYSTWAEGCEQSILDEDEAKAISWLERMIAETKVFSLCVNHYRPDVMFDYDKVSEKFESCLGKLKSQDKTTKQATVEDVEQGGNQEMNKSK